MFPPALNALQQLVQAQRHPLPVAYFHPRWTRRDAPLLDHLGVVLDHVHAYAKGGATDKLNLAVACSKCNSVKSDISAPDHAAKHPKRRVRGRFGEPVAWDGLAAVFLVLARRQLDTLTPTDRQWLAALDDFYSTAC